jgi:dienelactone hydrolase
MISSKQQKQKGRDRSRPQNMRATVAVAPTPSRALRTGDRHGRPPALPHHNTRSPHPNSRLCAALLRSFAFAKDPAHGENILKTHNGTMGEPDALDSFDDGRPLFYIT